MVWALVALPLVGCQFSPKLPPVDLAERGWTTRQGQAIWSAKKDAPEIAGEILVATNADGRTFVQFTKTPLPFLVAQTTLHSWELQSIPNNKIYSAPGKPPVRVIWLWLPLCLEGIAPPAKLNWQPHPDESWRLENRQTGEFLEGYLSP